MIERTQKAPPTLGMSDADGELFSEAFREFVALCLQKDPHQRPTAATMAKHVFVTSTATDVAGTRLQQLLGSIPSLAQRYEAERQQAVDLLATTQKLGMLKPSFSFDSQEDENGSEEAIAAGESESELVAVSNSSSNLVLDGGGGGGGAVRHSVTFDEVMPLSPRAEPAPALPVPGSPVVLDLDEALVQRGPSHRRGSSDPFDELLGTVASAPAPATSVAAIARAAPCEAAVTPATSTGSGATGVLPTAHSEPADLISFFAPDSPPLRADEPPSLQPLANAFALDAPAPAPAAQSSPGKMPPEAAVPTGPHTPLSVEMPGVSTASLGSTPYSTPLSTPQPSPRNALQHNETSFGGTARSMALLLGTDTVTDAVACADASCIAALSCNAIGFSSSCGDHPLTSALISTARPLLHTRRRLRL
eukprot:SAG11_NODE_96_length_17016_cov_18.755113_9_plen_420_part_00